MKSTISQSQILKYRECPYSYAMHYKYKKQGIMWDPEVFNVGRTVHDVIDTYYKHHYTTETSEEIIYSTTYNILRNEWERILIEEKPKDAANQLKKASICLRNFAEFEASNINTSIPSKPLTEVKIYSGELMGIIDWFDPTRTLAIDFKTNTVAGVGYGNKLQATMYRELIKSMYDIDIEYFTFYFLYPNKKRYVKFGSATDQIYDDIIMYKDAILSSWKTGKFPKKPRTKSGCNGCQFKYYCGGV